MMMMMMMMKMLVTNPWQRSEIKIKTPLWQKIIDDDCDADDDDDDDDNDVDHQSLTKKRNQNDVTTLGRKLLQNRIFTLKGSVSRDFRPPVFFMIQTHLGPW